MVAKESGAAMCDCTMSVNNIHHVMRKLKGDDSAIAVVPPSAFAA